MSVPPPSAKPASVPPPAAAAVEGKSPATALMLSLVITGAGHWYTGELARGAAFLLATALAALLLAPVAALAACLAIAAGAAYDARRSAVRVNARV